MKTQTIFTALLFIALCGVSAFAQKAQSTQSVRDIDRAASQPFYKSTTNPNITIGPVPEGKVLVLESVTGKVASGEVGTGGITLYTLYQGGVETINIFAPSYYTEHASSNKTYITHTTKLYIPAGRSMQLAWQGDVTPVFYYATISGHYVDVQ